MNKALEALTKVQKISEGKVKDTMYPIEGNKYLFIVDKKQLLGEVDDVDGSNVVINLKNGDVLNWTLEQWTQNQPKSINESMLSVGDSVQCPSGTGSIVAYDHASITPYQVDINGNLEWFSVESLTLVGTAIIDTNDNLAAVTEPDQIAGNMTESLASKTLKIVESLGINEALNQKNIFNGFKELYTEFWSRVR